MTERPTGTSKVRDLKVGELVLVGDDDAQHGKWPLGRIEKVMPGDDGVVRVVDVKTKDGSYTHPGAKHYRLEDD